MLCNSFAKVPPSHHKKSKAYPRLSLHQNQRQQLRTHMQPSRLNANSPNANCLSVVIR